MARRHNTPLDDVSDFVVKTTLGVADAVFEGAMTITKEAGNAPRELLKAASQFHRSITRFAFGDTRKRPRPARLTYRDKKKSLLSKLIFLYGEERGRETFHLIEARIASFRRSKPGKLARRDAHFNPRERFTQKDAVLITYPDSIRSPRGKPLATFGTFAETHLGDAFTTVHLLPFYPSSSDRGFSVINYQRVDPSFGTWNDIDRLGDQYKLMFDGVFNHASRKSHWFEEFLDGNPAYKDHFIAYDTKDAIPPHELAKIVRPRTTPLLTPFKTREKTTRYVWTTFNADQVDLNYREPHVLLRVINAILSYASHGALLIRLDAVNYLWKEIGTSCVHLKQTHTIVQLLRDVLDLAAPSVSLITETNVPHALNVKYFGSGMNEAQMVYNFALPPLVLHTFYKENAKHISRWADRLESAPTTCSYFNFLASHDGIGLMPAKRVLPVKEVSFLIKEARKRGSLVQYKSRGMKNEPYELNITWWDALNNIPGEPEELAVKRYLASISVSLSIKGVPGIYLHSLFGTKNDVQTVAKTKTQRDINRENFLLADVETMLAAEGRTRGVFTNLKELLHLRGANKAFHPGAEQRILLQNDAVFSLLRTSTDQQQRILVLINVTPREQQYTAAARELGLRGKLYDIVQKRHLTVDDSIEMDAFTVTLKPYDVRWIRAENNA